MTDPTMCGSISTLKGDVNGEEKLNVADLFHLVNYIYAGGPAPIVSGDVNADSKTDAADVFYLATYLFAAGRPPL